MQNSSQSSIGSSQIHQLQALSIHRVHESFARNNPIAFDESKTETDKCITPRSQNTMQISGILAVDQIGMDKPILKGFKAGQQIYPQVCSGTGHSSDKEFKISQKVQQAACEAKKDPQSGKITFIAKLVRSPGTQFDYFVQNIQPKGHKQILKVKQIKSLQKFALYEIDTDSSHRKIAVHLTTKDKILTSTQILAFARRSIYISENLSYDFQIGSQLKLNPLQGILAACILQGERLCEQIIEICGKNILIGTILAGDQEIDEHTKALINNHKCSVSVLKMLKFLLQEEKMIFSKPARNITERSYKVVAKIYIQQILKFNPNSNGQDISQQQIVEYFELFLHLLCLQQLKFFELKFGTEIQKLIKTKTLEIIEYSFRTKELSLYHKYVQFSINTGIFNMPVNYDTIKEYIAQFFIKSPDVVQAGFQNILYHAKNNSKKNVINMIWQTFSKGAYESSNIYQKHIRDILSISTQVFNEIDPKTLTIQAFMYLYTVYYTFRSNKQLVAIARDQKFRSIVTEFISQLKEKIAKGDQKQKIIGLQVIKRFFVTERDDQLISSSVPLKNWIPYFFQSYYRNAKIMSPLVRLWLQMIKWIDKLFSYQLIKSISISSSKILQRLTIQDAFDHINRHFKEEFLHIQRAMEVIIDFVVGPLINRLLPQDHRTAYLLVNQSHREWNHGFRYHLFINEMIVEKMLRIVNKIFKDDDFDRIQAIKKMKAEINRSIGDQNDRNRLRAIVQIQFIQLSKEDVWSYFVQRREYLKTLIKILKNNDQRSQELKSSLKDILKDLVFRRIPFSQIQKIKTMKPQEWHLFEQLTGQHDIPFQINTLYQYGNNYQAYALQIKIQVKIPEKMEEIEFQKKNMFRFIRIEEIMKLVHPIFQFDLEYTNSTETVRNLIKNITRQFEMSSYSLLQKQCQEIVHFLQPGCEVNEENLQQIMVDKQAMEKQQTFNQAITRYFTDKKFFGPVALFLKYLFQKQAYFSYSSQFLHQFVESEAYNLSQEVQLQFQRAKKSQAYQQFMNDIFKVKSTFIKIEYKTMKMQRRLPNPQKKYSIRVNRPRLIPYSKVQCQALLNFKERELGWLAKQIYVNKQEHKNDQAYNSYADELKKKTSFKNPSYNFYSKYFDSDKNLRTMLFFDLLADFASLKDLPTKFVPQFYQSLLPIIHMQDKNPKFAKIVGVLLGFQDIWVEIFKIVTIFYQQDSGIQVKFRPGQKKLSLEVMKEYCKEIIQQIVKCLLAPDCLRTRFNANKFCRVLINSLFHIQKLGKKLQLNISKNIVKLKSIRTSLVFLQVYDPSKKVENVQHFINKIAQNPTLNFYQVALDMFDTLKIQAKPQQIKLVTQFQANTLFYDWLKQKDPKKKNLIQFIKKCSKDENFAHNSVATLNRFVQVLKPNYKDIMGCFKKFNNINERDGHVVEQLLYIGEYSRKNNFKDNLSIVIVNMFVQKIVLAFEKVDILLKKAKEFEDIITKLSKNQLPGLSKHFCFAFVKVFLENYIDKFVEDDRKYQKIFQIVDIFLSNETSIYSSNFRFLCAKLLRTKMSIKQIKTEYLSKKKCKWIALIQKKIDVFLENQSRSIIVPKDTSNTSQNLKAVIKRTIELDGKPDHFDQIFAAGCKSPYDRYSLLNFFLRFYFSMLYDHRTFKTLVISKLQKQKARYEQCIGYIQFQLIWRYANNKFDENIFIQAPQQFSQDKIIFFNSFNWLLATKQASSPLNSLFFENGGKIHKNFTNAFENQFFPCGPENPFINIAKTVYEQTRNNDIGVFLCSSKCDVLYCHAHCGWPNETSKCPICKENIGCKPGRGFTIVKDQLGARRVMSPLLKDTGVNFYNSNLSKVPFFFDAQRCYIQAQINRMMEKSEVIVSGKYVKLKGYKIQNQGRVSSLTYYIIRHILPSLFYCFTSMKLISPQQAQKIFQINDHQLAKAQFFHKYTEDIKYIKKYLGLDNKIYGWIYGVHAFVFESSLNFKSKFNQHVLQTQNRSKQLVQNIQAAIAQKTIKDVYLQMFKDIMNALRNGLITKQLQAVNNFTAQNRFTRDTFEVILERFIKKVTAQQRFSLAEESFELQGFMQFPNDIYLTEDKIDEEKFQFSKVLKLPNRVVKYSQILASYQQLIRQQYPFLDYILKNSDQINRMIDFSNILLFSNYLSAQITNNFERIDAEKPIGLFIEELKKQKSNEMPDISKQPEIVVVSWNKLAKRLGVLQYKCKIMGQMNDQYSLQTPTKAFLVQSILKKNPYGMMLSVVFCNFAEMHNDLVNILNGKINQIPQYRCLNLLDQTVTLNTQNLKQSDVYTVTEKQLQEKFYQFSVSSINYGRSFLFINFQSYQHYFIMKLSEKGLFNSNIEDLKSICYNGEAFAKTSEYSNTLAQIKGYFDLPLTETQKKLVRQTLRNKNRIEQIQKCAIKVRGDLERMMIVIRKCNGLIDATDIADFRDKYELSFSAVQTSQFGQIEVAKIVYLYEYLELQMKPSVLQKIDDDYKFKLQLDEQSALRELFDMLPIVENDECVTLSEFGHAVYRFIARNLQGNMLENDINLLAFLPEREDFWPKGFDAYTKLQPLIQHPVLATLTIKHICALFSILQNLLQEKVGQSKI